MLSEATRRCPSASPLLRAARGDRTVAQGLKDIVSSQLDADRLDYILRDGLATGVRIGVYDFERIQTMFEPTASRGRPAGRRLAVSYRAREAVEGYLIARFHMFKQVYLHKAVRAAEKMLEAVLRARLRAVRAPRRSGPPAEPGDPGAAHR